MLKNLLLVVSIIFLLFNFVVFRYLGSYFNFFIFSYCFY
ncbi:hypothetical protein CBB_A0154 [Clostridium botulinum Bf]|nr:hypothetical protein CBB_A0154 [Clostridium botulinum Bf]